MCRPILGLDSVVNSVPILVGRITLEASFFVIIGANYYCILGQPFIITLKIKLFRTTNSIDRLEYAKLYNKKRRKIL